MAKMGRPSKFNKDITDKICVRIANGESLRTICKDDDLPDRATILKWVIQGMASDAPQGYKDFYHQYTYAREIQIEALADECCDIADDSTNDYVTKISNKGKEYQGVDQENIQRSRLRIETRKWFASKLIPKKYGDKIQQEITGRDGADLIPSISISITKPKE